MMLFKRASLAIAVAASLAIPSLTRPALADTLTVTGTGTVLATPNVARLSFTIPGQGDDPAQAFADSARAVQALTESLAKLGIAADDILVSDQYVERNNTLSPILWASNTLIVTIRDSGQVSAVHQAALQHGLWRMVGVAYGFSHPSALLAQARRAAVADALTQAEQNAAESGRSLGSILALTDNGFTEPLSIDPPMFYKPEGTPIPLSPLPIVARVTLTYEWPH